MDLGIVLKRKVTVSEIHAFFWVRNDMSENWEARVGAIENDICTVSPRLRDNLKWS